MPPTCIQAKDILFPMETLMQIFDDLVDEKVKFHGLETAYDRFAITKDIHQALTKLT